MDRDPFRKPPPPPPFAGDHPGPWHENMSAADAARLTAIYETGSDPGPAPAARTKRKVNVITPAIDAARSAPAGRARDDHHAAQVAARRRADPEARRFARLRQELRAAGLDAAVNSRTTSTGTRYELTVPEDQQSRAAEVLLDLAARQPRRTR